MPPDSRTVKTPRRTRKRSAATKGVDNPRVPAVEWHPAVADWVRFLADLLTQEFLRPQGGAGIGYSPQLL